MDDLVVTVLGRDDEGWAQLAGVTTSLGGQEGLTLGRGLLGQDGVQRDAHAVAGGVVNAILKLAKENVWRVRQGPKFGIFIYLKR